MSYTYRLESRFFFWILSILFSSFVFSVLYFFQVFHKYITLTISFLVLVVLFFVGLFSYKYTIFFYNLVKKEYNLKKTLEKIADEETNNETLKLIKRFKEVFYSLNLSEKKESIKTIQEIVGLSPDSAENVYKILKNINFTKSVLKFFGLLLAVGCYFVFTKIPLFNFFKESVFFPFAIAFLFLFIFFYESIIVSKLPDKFYLTLIDINKKQIKKSLQEITLKENDLVKLENKKKELIKKLKERVTLLTEKGIKKKDIIEIYSSKQILTKQFKNFILDAIDNFPIPHKQKSASFQEIKTIMDEIESLYTQILMVDKEIQSFKQKIIDDKKMNESMQAINKKDWVYRNKNFKNKLNEYSKEIELEIYNKLDNFQELNREREKTIKTLYDTLTPYLENLTNEKVSSLLISKGYDYEMIVDLLDEFKKNYIDLNKNKRSFQDKIISKINKLYFMFKE